MGLDDIVVFHIQVVGRLVGLDADAVVEKAQRVHLLALALGEGLHEAAQRGGALDLEEDLAGAVGDLEIDVGFGLDFGLLLLLVGHGAVAFGRGRVGHGRRQVGHGAAVGRDMARVSVVWRFGIPRCTVASGDAITAYDIR